MRIGRVRFRMGVVVGALALAGCSKGTLMPEGGTAGGGSAPTGAGNRGGATGAGNAGGSGPAGCTAADVYTTCTPNVATPGALPPVGDACSVEGAHCEGYSCQDSFSGYAWAVSCCSGYWYSTSGSCPDTARPGDRFPCAGAGATLNCVAGQSFCSSSNEGRTVDFSYSCKPLCAAGDCTCFCDNPMGCDFHPAGSTCAADTCECFQGGTLEGIPWPGTVSVWCSFLAPGNGVCYRDASVDGQCGGTGIALLCEGARRDLGNGCSGLPDTVIAGSCGAEIHYYCCPG